MKLIIAAVLLAAVIATPTWYSVNDGEQTAEVYNLSEIEFASQYLMPLEPEELLAAPLKYTGNGDFEAKDWTGHECVHPIRDQGSCGSCWAFAITEVASDRYCLATGDKDLIFSPQELMDCDTQEGGCGGAATQRAVTWVASNGLVDDECVAYTQKARSCDTKCDDGSEMKLYNDFEDTVYTGAKAQIETLMKEFETGPVYFSMQVMSDFQKYAGGIFESDTNRSVGGHAVKCVGYGEVEGAAEDASFEDSHYWKCANSWGARWGEDGFFRIMMNQKIGYNAGYDQWTGKSLQTE